MTKPTVYQVYRNTKELTLPSKNTCLIELALWKINSDFDCRECPFLVHYRCKYIIPNANEEGRLELLKFIVKDFPSILLEEDS